MGVPLGGRLEWSHEVDGDFLEGVTFGDGYESVPLSLGVAVPRLADLASVDEIFYHLLESREVEVPSNSG